MEDRVALHVANHGRLSLVGTPGVRFTKMAMRTVLLAIVLHGLTRARRKAFQRQVDSFIDREYKDPNVIERGIPDLRRILTEFDVTFTLPPSSWLYIEKTVARNLQARRIGQAEPKRLRARPPPPAPHEAHDAIVSARAAPRAVVAA